MIKKIVRRALQGFVTKKEEDVVKKYLEGGRIPWSIGYHEFKFNFISESLADPRLLETFRGNTSLPYGFAKGLDERTVEYPWIFSRLSSGKKRMLDAGSTFNFLEILDSAPIPEKELTITTYYPEKNKFNQRRISYVYADLKNLPFRDQWFEEIVCQSTIEHIDMDNSIYGYKPDVAVTQKTYGFLLAIDELIRVLTTSGKLLLTFPFGKYKNYGFFQQLDEEMVGKILQKFDHNGAYTIAYLKYEKEGWRFSELNEMKEVVSYNPHTGEGKGDDGAAHCRGIACIEFTKS
jgi:hypothetical protein